MTLPPERANIPQTVMCQVYDLTSSSLCKEITVVVKLTENKRLDSTNQNAVIFDQFLDRLRDGESVKEDWNVFVKF